METMVRIDGRALAVEEAGDRDGRPVLVHAGTPYSRRLYARAVADAAGRGLRLISYDRPGYGGSTSQPDRIVADCARDVRAICEALGIDRLAMWGFSGGGPHVLACAALLPDLVVAAASLASLAPCDADGLDWLAGLGKGDASFFGLLRDDLDAACRELDERWRVRRAVSASGLADELTSQLTPAEAAAMRGELGDHLAASMRQALAPGSEGWWDDCRAQASPWGFAVAQISVPVLLLHGTQDNFVPCGHGEWLIRHIPDVEPRLLEGDGHLTLLEHRVGEVHAWLAGHL